MRPTGAKRILVLAAAALAASPAAISCSSSSGGGTDAGSGCDGCGFTPQVAYDEKIQVGDAGVETVPTADVPPGASEGK